MSIPSGDLTTDFLHLFYDDYLFEAYALYESNKTDQALLSVLPECALLLDDINYAQKAMETLRDIDNWKKVRQEQGIATYCHGTGDEFMIGVETMITQPVFPILALCAEVDLLPTLVHRMSEAQILASPTRFRRLVRYVYDVPWPVNRREAILQCAGFPIVETRSALLTVRSPTQNEYLGFPLAPADPKLVRCNVTLGGANLMCIEPNLTQMTIFGHADLKLRFIPTTVINFFGKHAAFYFAQSFLKQVSGFTGSAYEQRVKDKPEFYEELRRRVDVYTGF